jgi:SAM-dependent methyltransferase
MESGAQADIGSTPRASDWDDVYGREDRLRPAIWSAAYLGLRPLAEWVKAKVSGVAAPESAVLDLGAGMCPYRELYSGCAGYVATDVLPTPYVNVVCVNWDLPFADNSFDLVVCTQSLEHTLVLQRAVSEMRRVARPGGHILVTAPFCFVEHSQPYDYWRISQFGLRELFKEFEIIEIKGSGGLLRTVGNLWAHVMRPIPASHIWLAPLFLTQNLLTVAFEWVAARLEAANERWLHIAKLRSFYKNFWYGCPENYMLLARKPGMAE